MEDDTLREDLGCGESMFICKRVTKRYNMQVRSYVQVKKYSRETGELLETTSRKYNTMDADGIDLFLQLMTNSGSGASKHLNTVDSWLSVANADPIVTHGLTFGGADDRGNATPTKAAPSGAIFWEWHDDSITVRTNQNHIEMWYKDPDGMADEVKVNHIFANEGTKPADENWHWRMVMEMFSTDTDFQDIGFDKALNIIAGDDTIHYDGTNVFFRPFTSADSGLGSTGQNPDSAPSVSTAANTITWVTTVVDGNFNGAWDKMEVQKNTSYSEGVNRLRYGGCTTAGGSCGTKVAGEEYEYTYVFTLAQGS